MRNAFAPGGDYLSFWQPSVEATSLQSMHVMLVNDEYREVENTLTLALENSKSERIVNQTRKFKLAPLGQNTIYNDFKFPGTTGDFLLRAIIEYKANGGDVSTQSRRYARCGDWKGKLIRIICNPVIRYFPKSARLTKSFRTC